MLVLTRLFSSPVSRLLLCPRLVPLLSLEGRSVPCTLVLVSNPLRPPPTSCPEQNPKFHWNWEDWPLPLGGKETLGEWPHPAPMPTPLATVPFLQWPLSIDTDTVSSDPLGIVI